MSLPISIGLVLSSFVVVIYVLKYISFVKNKRKLENKKTKEFEQNLKETLPNLFNKDNWKIISEERIVYKPTGEEFTWGITYLDDLVLMFPKDIERKMTFDEQMVLFYFLKDMTTNAFKVGNWNYREDLIRKYG